MNLPKFCFYAISTETSVVQLGVIFLKLKQWIYNDIESSSGTLGSNNNYNDDDDDDVFKERKAGQELQNDLQGETCLSELAQRGDHLLWRMQHHRLYSVWRRLAIFEQKAAHLYHSFEFIVKFVFRAEIHKPGNKRLHNHIRTKTLPPNPQLICQNIRQVSFKQGRGCRLLERSTMR